MNEYQEKICALAKAVWDSEQDAEEFMGKPHPFLEDRAPLDVATTETGAKRVEEILQKIRWGLPR